MALTPNELAVRPRTFFNAAAAGAGSVDITSGAEVRLMGAAVTSTGGASFIEIHDATATTGTPTFVLGCGANETSQISFEPTGIRLTNGLSIEDGANILHFVVWYLEEGV